jgi:hypothetical protein
MSENLNPSEGNVYTGYSDLMTFFKSQQSLTPKGVSLKLERNKYLLLQFVHPDTGKRSPKPCNVKFTYEGIVLAVSKAHKVAESLNTFKVASEFWSWYDSEILEINSIENDLVTYRDIFTQIETEYFNGRHKNTKNKRSKDNPSDVSNFNRGYGRIFKKFPNLDSYPNWAEIKSVLFSWKQGSNQFEKSHDVLKRICEMSANSKELLAKLEQIDDEQYDFKELQSISLNEFLNWYDSSYSEIPHLRNKNHRNARQSWLWVCSMCVLYGLRPSEIAAAKNLTEAVTIDGVHFKAISDKTNKDLLLVLGDYTYFGASIKTGGRICIPMVTDKKLIERLHIQLPSLPIYTPEPHSKPESICNGFNNQFTQRITGYKCPVTQKYAFRHLCNQLGEQYGIPQEIRARCLGHSVNVNDTVYKARNNTQTTVDLLTKHSKHPLPLDMAKQQLESLGFSLDDSSVKAILRIVYQLDSI